MYANSQMLNEVEIENKIKNSKTVKRGFLKDKTGIYDREITYILLDHKQQIIYSNVLRKGIAANLDKDFFDFLKHITVPNPYGEHIYDFLDIPSNKSKYEDELRLFFNDTMLTFDEPEKIQQRIASNFEKIVQNRDKLLLPLLVYVGELLKKKVSGEWQVILDENFLCHSVVILDSQNRAYLPFYIVRKFLDGDIPNIEFYLDVYAN